MWQFEFGYSFYYKQKQNVKIKTLPLAPFFIISGSLFCIFSQPGVKKKSKPKEQLTKYCLQTIFKKISLPIKAAEKKEEISNQNYHHFFALKKKKIDFGPPHFLKMC